MGNQRYSWTNTDIALATGDDAGAGAGLTDWINNKASFIQGELIPSDRFIDAVITFPKPKHLRTGSMAGSYVKGRVKTGVKEGLFRGKFYLQTVQFAYWLMQTAGTPTTEGTPAGFNTHDLVIGATQIPDWHGIHLQRKVTTKHRINDLMGFLPSKLSINCTEEESNWTAKQNITIPFSYSKSGSSLTPETKRPQHTVGSKYKNWGHAVTGGLGENQTALKYNNVDIPCAIKGIHLNLNREKKWGVKDEEAYPAEGFMQGFDYPFSLDIEPYDKVAGVSIFDINDLDPQDYAGDLDFDFSFIADPTNDKQNFIYDKLAMLPFDENAIGEGLWFEGYRINFEPLDETSSLNIIGIDNLDNTHFENP